MTNPILTGCLGRGFLKIFVAIAVLVPWTSFSCSFNTDCYPGSQCIKASGQIYGVCLGGISPGNKFDQQPVYSPLDINNTTGNTCSFDTDCGPGSKCVKGGGSIYGACLRRQSVAPMVTYRQQHETQQPWANIDDNVATPAPATPPPTISGTIAYIINKNSEQIRSQQKETADKLYSTYVNAQTSGNLEMPGPIVPAAGPPTQSGVLPTAQMPYVESPGLTSSDLVSLDQGIVPERLKKARIVNKNPKTKLIQDMAN